MDSDDKKITQLTQVTSLSDSDLFVVAIDVGTAPKTRAITKANALAGASGGGGEGILVNGVISVSVVSNDLVLAIKTLAGTDPSSSDKVTIQINGVVREITAATSCTLADGTNWMGLGGAAFGTLEQDLFAYAVWDSNSSVVAVSCARIPFGRLVSDFNSTNTNERHLVDYANFTTTDSVTNIGRFAATLSLSGTSHLWTVPTFTNLNLINYPIFTTRRLSFSPVWSNLTVGDGTQTAFYVLSNELVVHIDFKLGSTSSISGDPTHSKVMAQGFSFVTSGASPVGLARLRDASGDNYSGVMILSTSILCRAQNITGTYLIQTPLSSTVPFTWTNTDGLTMDYSYLLE